MQSWECLPHLGNCAVFEVSTKEILIYGAYFCLIRKRDIIYGVLHIFFARDPHSIKYHNKIFLVLFSAMWYIPNLGFLKASCVTFYG